jgi:Leucine-rich repeat (LRR) protein
MKTKLLLLLLLANFSIYAQTNIVPNGSFETWSSSSHPDSWYSFISGFVSQSAIPQSGTSSTNMMIASGTFNFINSEYFAVEAGKTYRVTMYHKAVKGSFSSIDFSLYHKPGTFKEEIIKKSDVTFSTTEWRKVEFEYSPTVSENIEVDIWTTGSLDSEILVDNVSVIDINEAPAQYTTIPDANFEKRLIELGIDSGEVDGKVLTSKVSIVKSLKVDPTIISDLTGLEDFIALEQLDCRNDCISTAGGGCGKITNLNVSKNTLLTQLYCQGNQLTTLDLSQNTKLMYLYCQANKLTSLNLSKNTALNAVDFSYNKLTEFDSSNNVSLSYLMCRQNKLTSLDLTKNPFINTLSCSRNELNQINISTLSRLAQLGVDYNKLTELDLSNKPDLIIMNCESNLITNLNVAQIPQLQELTCTNNKLTNLDVTQNTELKILACGNNTIPNFDITKNLKLVELECSSLNLNEIDVTHLTNLKELSASSNNLKTIDVSNNLKLTELYLNTNQFTTIDVTKNVLLTTLSMDDNKLTELNPANNTVLRYVVCSNNLLTSLDVSANKKVEYVNVNNNKLTYLNLKNGIVSMSINISLPNFQNNPDLKCIQVTDAKYAKSHWSYYADPTVRFAEDCGGPIEVAPDNFSVEVKGESCLGENNGVINISAKEKFIYQASINGKTYPFTEYSLKVENLLPGTYPVLVTIPGENFEQTFNITITKGLSISGKSNVSAKKVNVEITEGTAPFTIFVDGAEQFQTTDSSFSLDLNSGGLLEVATAKACEGVFSKKIATLDIPGALGAYPNPTSGSFAIEIPTAKTDVKIELYNFGGQLISNKTYTIENGKVQLNLENQPSGIYAAKIYLATPEYLKIIKK